MQILINTVIGNNRGKERVWLEQTTLRLVGEPGAKLALTFNGSTLKAKLDESGSLLISKRKVRNQNTYKPLIELRDRHCLDAFGKTLKELFPMAKKLRVVIKKGLMLVKVAVIELSKLLAVASTLEKLRNQSTLSIATFYAGAGIFDRAMHKGLEQAGLKAKADLIVERESKYLDVLYDNQRDILSDDCLVCCSDVRGLLLTRLEKRIDIFLASPPCTAVSPSGRAKKSLSKPEDDPDAGDAFVDVLSFVCLNTPTVVVLENERSYVNTASFSVIENRLKHLGYKVSYEVLNGVDYGSFEPRKRVFLVATLISEYDFSNIPKSTNIRTISSILEDVALDSPRWKSFDYLVAKEERDRAEGKGFSRSLHDGSETKLKNIIRRLYSKGGSCDPFVQHPTDEEKSRLFTKLEHARLRDLDESLLLNVNEGCSHEFMGQSGVYSLVEKLAYEIGVMMKRAA
ncbi:DNA cytosine methyltransferase [Pseudoalteromonas luteoviolacea]|uniref:Uncharacterized protein n=1 Tax=Pseudoalteromonas luteoviolacea S4060-1 TaxID=1365257 RepID=A0A167KUT0_9GAMM|nr:DNA cytosine methyltransferase [Pseudoalteromonas luteoviolacea]KZN63308.1 hypothetical protein N478_03400 [Pseudoalteromonas luteoviolacea S4060-1]